MKTQQNSSAEELQSQQSRDLTQLQKQIELTNVQLLQLTYNDGIFNVNAEKFMAHINNLNSKGIQYLNKQEHKEAMIFFNESEKILEYAASCGKTIDRAVIVATLHNQACVNQKLWDLEKSANYIEAIIYNISFYFENTLNKAAEFQNLQEKEKQNLDELVTFIYKKQIYALYHLQFCAVNSQIRRHNISANSARAAIHIMKQVCYLSYLLSQNIIYNDILQISQARQNSDLLKQLSELEQELEVRQYENFFKTVRILINNTIHQLTSEDELKNIRNFSIGKLMQLSPMSIAQTQTKCTVEQWLKYENVICLTLYMGVCYFTVGTELRFISSQQNEDKNEVYKLSQQFLVSEVYHIYAIMIVMNYVPVRSIFLNHLLSSFNNHYEIDLEKTSSIHIFGKNISDNPVNKGNAELQENKQSSQASHIANQPIKQENSPSEQLPPYPILSKQTQLVNSNMMSVPTKIQAEQNEQGIENNPKMLTFTGTLTQKSLLFIKSQPNEPELNVVHQKIKRSASKSPKHFVASNQNKSKKSVSSSKEKKLKYKTLDNIYKNFEREKNEKDVKDKSSKSKSKEKKKSIPPNKKSNSKICIYIVRNKIDCELEAMKSKKSRQSRQKKSSSKSLKKSTRDISSQKFKISTTFRRSQSKQKQFKFKNIDNKIKIKKSKSKSKYERHDKEKYKMNKVPSARNQKQLKFKV